MRRYENSKYMLLETYRNEVYPADNCLAIASIGLHGKATGTDHSQLLDRIIGSFREVCIDEKSGLMFQSINNFSGGIGRRVVPGCSQGVGWECDWIRFDARVSSIQSRGIWRC